MLHKNSILHYLKNFHDFLLTSKKKYDIVIKHAGMAELADAHGSGPCGSNTMRVQVPLSASHGGDRKVAAFVVSEKYNTKPGKGRKPWQLQLIEETKRRQTGHRKYTRTGTNWICRPSYTRPYREEIFLPFIVCPFF